MIKIKANKNRNPSVPSKIGNHIDGEKSDGVVSSGVVILGI